MRDLRVFLSSELDTGYVEVCTGLVTVSDVDVPVVSANDRLNDTQSEARSGCSCRGASCSIAAGGLLVVKVRRARLRTSTGGVGGVTSTGAGGWHTS